AAATADRITRRLGLLGSRQPTHPEILSLNGLLRRLARLIESTAGDGIEVALRLSPRAGHIRADLAQMEASVMNLVGHACKALARASTRQLPAERVQRNAAAGLPETSEAADASCALDIETSHAELPTGEYVAMTITYSAAEPDIDRLFDPESPSEA